MAVSRPKQTQADRDKILDSNRLIKDAPKPKKRKTTVKSPLEQPVKEVEKYKCFSCGEVYDKLEKNFIRSPHPMFAGNRGYVHICKRCMDHYLVEYEIFHDNDSDAAVRHLAMYLGLYASDSNINMSRLVNRQQSRMTTLAAKQGMHQNIGKTYDTYLKELSASTKIESVEDLKEANESGGTKISQKTLKFWGTGYPPDDYVFLNDKYEDWTSRHECKTKAQESIFQKICLIELQITKAIQSGDDKSVSGLTKAFNDLLASANIKPVQNKGNALADQNTFGTLIQKWENERPIPDPDPEWKDVDGIRKYISAWFTGHLCKMLGIKNSNTELYEKEISQYSVKKPEYEEDAESSFEEVFGLIEDVKHEQEEGD